MVFSCRTVLMLANLLAPHKQRQHIRRIPTTVRVQDRVQVYMISIYLHKRKDQEPFLGMVNFDFIFRTIL
jgi:hypothetical protein